MPNPKIESPLGHAESLGRAELTSAALLTGVGRSAIAVIAVAGPGAAQVMQQCFAPATQRGFAAGQVRYGNWTGGGTRDFDSNGKSRVKTSSDVSPIAAAESVVVVPVTNNEFEIHCHGGVAATERILSDLQQHNVRVVDWHGGLWKPDEPLLIREAQAVLSRCLTARTAAIIMDQVRGALLQWCHKTLTGQASFESTRDEANEILSFGGLGMSLNDRFRVVLAGRPNVGKSSLINAIVGYDRSITLDHPGTTRDVLHAETVIDGWPIQLSDTAGIRDGEGEIEREGIRRANQAVSDADLVIWVTTPESSEVPDEITLDDASQRKVIHVLNKADLLKSAALSRDTLKTVATTGEGVTELMTAISRDLVPRLPPPQSPVLVNRRQKDCLEMVAAASDADTQQQAITELIAGAELLAGARLLAGDGGRQA